MRVSRRFACVTDVVIGEWMIVVSAKHAVITCEVKNAEHSPPEFEIKVVDVSRNGLILNGERLVKDKHYTLKDGDLLTLPFNVEYRFELNPEGVLPRATRVSLDDYETPAQKKVRTSPDAVKYESEIKRGRDDGLATGALQVSAVNEALSAENSGLRERIATLEAERLKSAARLSDLEAEVEALRTADKEVMESQAAAVEVVQSMKQELEGKLREVDEYAARVEALEEDKAALEEDKAERAEAAGFMEAAIKEMDEKILEMEETRVQQVNELQTRVDQAYAEVEATNQEIAMHKMRAERAEAELKDTEFKLVQTEAKLEQTEAKHASAIALEESLKESNAQNKKLAQIIESQKQMLNNLRSKYETIKHVVEQFGAEFKTPQSVEDATNDDQANDDAAHGTDADMNEAAGDQNNDEFEKDQDDAEERDDDDDDDYEVHAANSQFTDSIGADVFPQAETQRVNAVEDNEEVTMPSPLRSIGNSPRAESERKRLSVSAAARQSSISQDE